MNKIILLLLFVTNFTFAQKIGNADIIIEGNFTEVDLDNFYEKWIESNTSYIMKFKINPIGVKHAFEKTKAILYKNNVPFSKTETNSNHLASYVDGLDDYEDINLSINDGSSEIRMSWFLGDQLFLIYLKEGSYILMCTK
jgi:hypothetical protein